MSNNRNLNFYATVVDVEYFDDTEEILNFYIGIRSSSSSSSSQSSSSSSRSNS